MCPYTENDLFGRLLELLQWIHTSFIVQEFTRNGFLDVSNCFCFILVGKMISMASIPFYRFYEFVQDCNLQYREKPICIQPYMQET
eukprot:c18226_g1_i1 orf=60-317(-)